MGQSYADAKGFKYNACATQIATSLGGVGSVVGIVDAPVRCVLNANTSVEAKTRSTPATQFLVVKGVEHMYDVLVSTNCAQDYLLSCMACHDACFHVTLISPDNVVR